jgi:AcrR family transcriptional regulator
MLNMFKTMTPKGEETRGRIFETAMTLFREKGFEATTMRDVAGASDQSLGAAYHYFPSKDAIVLAYYERVHAEHVRRVREAGAVQETGRLRERLSHVMHTKVDILGEDRPLMGALLKYAGDPAHPLSFFGRATRDLRLRSMALFHDVLQPEHLPGDLRALAPTLLWTMHMGLLLYFLYDDSPKQRRTRALTDAAVGLFIYALALAKLAALRPLRRKVLRILDQADLLISEGALVRAAALDN